MTPDEAVKAVLSTPEWKGLSGFNVGDIYGDFAVAVAKVLAAAEREACAQIAHLYVEKAWPAQDIAADIRSRGETKE